MTKKRTFFLNFESFDSESFQILLAEPLNCCGEKNNKNNENEIKKIIIFLYNYLDY